MSIAVLVLVLTGSGELSNKAHAAQADAEPLSSIPVFSSSGEAPAAPPVAPSAPEEEPNRADCARIRGTEYLSFVERTWFFEHCLAENRASCGRISGTPYLSDVERGWFLANCMSQDARLRVAAQTPSQPPSIPAAAAEPVVVIEEPKPHTPVEAFAAGYRAAGGAEGYLERILYRVIPCESTWNTHAVNHAGPFYGLMQFMPATWNAVGGGDWFDPYQQGANTARLLVRANPATQWPVCWFA